MRQVCRRHLKPLAIDCIMKPNFSLPPETQKQIFITELVKSGVDYAKAVETAQVIVSGKADEELSDDEAAEASAVCREWLKQRKRSDFINHVLYSLHTPKQ